MPGGRPRKPTEQKRAVGNPGKRQLPEPLQHETVEGPPAPPDTLEGAGHAAWIRVWTAGARWLSPSSDWDLLVLICEAYDRRERIKQALAVDVVFGTTDKGFIYVHPGFAALRNADGQIARWLGLCGFSPSDRSRLGLSEVKKQSALEELLARRAKRETSPPAAQQSGPVAAKAARRRRPVGSGQDPVE